VAVLSLLPCSLVLAFCRLWLTGLLHAGLDLAFVFQVLFSLRKEIREKNEREDNERHGTPDAQSEHSALALTLFTVCHLSSSQGHVRSSFLAHMDERIESRLLEVEGDTDAPGLLLLSAHSEGRTLLL